MSRLWVAAIHASRLQITSMHSGDAKIERFLNAVPISAPDLKTALEVAEDKCGKEFPKAEGFFNQCVVVGEITVEQLRLHDYVEWLEMQSVVKASDLTEFLGRAPEYAASGEKVVSTELRKGTLTEP